MSAAPSDPDVETRVESLVEGANLAPVAQALETRHDEIVDRWLRQARRQPFHPDQAEIAVADHIPELLRAIAAVPAHLRLPIVHESLGEH